MVWKGLYYGCITKVRRICILGRKMMINTGVVPEMTNTSCLVSLITSSRHQNVRDVLLTALHIVWCIISSQYSCVFGDGREFWRWTGFIIWSGNSSKTAHICVELLHGKSPLEIHSVLTEVCSVSMRVIWKVPGPSMEKSYFFALFFNVVTI